MPAARNVMPLIRSKEDWLEPWYPIEDAARAGALLKELRAELSNSHVIYGIGAHAIGARQDCDDCRIPHNRTRYDPTYRTPALK